MPSPYLPAKARWGTENYIPSKNAVGRMTGQRVRLGSLFDRKSPGGMTKRPCHLACIRGKLAGHAFAVSPCQSALGDGELHPLKKCCREDDGTARPPRQPLRQEVPRRYGEAAMSSCLHQGETCGSCLRRISLPKRAGGGVGGTGGGGTPSRARRGGSPPPVRKTSPSAASCQLPAAYRLPGGRVVRHAALDCAKVVLR